jgi:hypothetical protein
MPFIGNKPSAVPLTSADIADGIITSAKIVDGTIANTDISSTAAIAQSKILGNPLTKNAIINGDFAVAQRATSFTSTGSANNDDTYTLDRWYILSDGNDAIDVTQETSVVPTNELYAIALDVETANKKFGIAQIIEQKNCVGLIGNTVTLSFKAKVSATTKLDNVKCAIVAWSGTADTVTSDIISAWGAEGTNPTLIANATYENTPANLNVTTSYATYSVSAAVDTSSTKNIIVFIWSDVTDTTAGDFLYITDVQLEKGSAASDFEFLPIDVSLARCQRYYEKFLAETVSSCINNTCMAVTTDTLGIMFKTTQRMRAIPTGNYSGTIQVGDGTANYNITSMNVAGSQCSTYMTFFNAYVASGLTAFRWYRLEATAGTDFVELSAEL